jgi:glycolate oxidase FAD binding subunit
VSPSASDVAEVLEPASFEEAAELLAQCAADGSRVRFRGGGTKLAWGTPVEEPFVWLSSRRLDQVVAHNAGDLTAVFQAGVPLAVAQAALRSARQRLALDPPLGRGDAATIGGVVATGDFGPLRHRYGPPRDLILGMTVALSDGTVARSGGTVIKNVAGYDLGKLFAGSFGTLGMILEVAVRLHPLPADTAAAVARTSDPEVLQRAAVAVAAEPLELEALTVVWVAGTGTLLARAAGAAPAERAERAAIAMAAAGAAASVEPVADGGGSAPGRPAHEPVVLQTVARASGLAEAARCASRLGVMLSGNAVLGSWRFFPSREDAGAILNQVRTALAPAPVIVRSAPEELRAHLDAWGPIDPGGLALMRRVKERFDPAGACNPGLFVGGI